MRNAIPKVFGLLVVALATATTAGAAHVVGQQASPCLNLRSAPGGSALACLEPGVQVQVTEAAGDWGLVKLADGAEGWMALAYLTPVAGPSAEAKQQSGQSSASPVDRSAGSKRLLVVEAEATADTSTILTGGLLYDQTDSPAGAGFNSQLYEAANSAFDCRAADDFTVPAADIQWNVAEVLAVGNYLNGTGPTAALNLEIFMNGGGVPGASVCSYPGLLPGVDYTDNGSGTLSIVLPSVCLLPVGDYWVSVQADMDSSAGGQWLWAERSAATGANFAWENPPDGFGTGCVAWTPAGGCGASAPDLLFTLGGQVVPVELQSITID